MTTASTTSTRANEWRVTVCGIPPRKPRPWRVRGVVVDGVYRRHPLSVYPRLGQRVEECGIPPLKPRPGPARGLVLDGRYHRHPPAGDGEHRPNPNQRDWGTPGRKPRSHFKRSTRTDIEADQERERGRRKRSGPRAARGPRRP